MIKDVKFSKNKYAFEISYISEQGGRHINEDSVAVECLDENLLVSVADGLGAHGGGDIASKIASDIAKKEYMKIGKPTSKNIYGIFYGIDDAIVAEQTEELKMKTTLACVLCRNKWIYGAHLGDTRIYTFYRDKNVHLTVDHSVAYNEVMRNHGTLDDIRKNPNRHILTAALGVGKRILPETFKQKIKQGMSVLICSDGFWEYVNEDEIQETLAKTATSHDWLEAMLTYHSQKAVSFNDNYSAICLRIIKT